MKSIIVWLVALMMLQSPPDKGALAGRFVKDAVETTEQRIERYQAIATAIATVAFDPNEKPVFGGRTGRFATASLLLAISWMESGWRRDVDLGLGKEARGGGMDTCSMQIRLGKNEKTREGWDWQDIVNDREKCFRAGLHIVRRSFAACSKLPVEHRLSAYASGSCHESLLGQGRMIDAWKKSAARISVARKLMGRIPLPTLEPDDT
jgi:hypothetical protein